MNIEWFQSPLLDQIGWALVHFLWQGAVVAALLFLTLRTIPVRKASARYLTACAALLIAFSAPLITFAMINAIEEAATSVVVDGATVQHGSADSERILASTETFVVGAERGRSIEGAALVRRQAEWLLPLVVVGWLAGVSVLSVRLGFGWISLQILKRSRIDPLPYWTERVTTLQVRMGIRRVVRVVQSGRVTVPSTLGCWRPLILLPASALSGLTPAQIEAVLFHELAHIRRHDYVVNLLQSFVETALFYHPAVWWISRQIRNERENCCDDAAVATGSDRIEYARALTSLEEVRAGASLQMAAGGGDLTSRVRRLLGAPPRTGALGGWMASLITLAVVSAVVVVGQVQNGSRVEQEAEATGAPPVIQQDDATLEAPDANGNSEGLNRMGDMAAGANGQSHQENEPTAAQESEAPLAPSIVDQEDAPLDELKTPENPEDEADSTIPELTSKGASAPSNGQSEQIQIQISLSEIPEQLAFELGFAMPAKAQEHSESSPDSKDLGLRPATTTAILTPAQFSKLIDILKVTGGVDILTSPKITTLDGRAAQLKVTELKTIVSDVDVQPGQATFLTSKAQLGPSVNIEPMILENGRAIRLNVSSDVTEFLGYDDPGQFVPQGGGSVQVQKPLPAFRVRQISGSGIVYDSQTLALLGCRTEETIVFKDKVPVLGDIPLMGRLFRREGTQTQIKHLLILVTPTRVHPNGEPVFPAGPSSIDRSVPPPQYQIKRTVE